MNERPTDVAFVASALRAFALGVGGIGMTALSVVVASGVLGNDPGGFGAFAGYIGTLFFGIGTVGWFWLSARRRGIILIVDSGGILDRRLSDTVLPWSAVRDAVAVDIYRQRFVLVRLDPAFDATWPKKRGVGMTLRANRALGIDGYPIGLQGLKGNFDSLLEAVTAQLAHWRQQHGVVPRA